MSQQRPNARRTAKRPAVARGEQKQVSGQSEPSSLQSIGPSRDDHAAWLAYWQEQNQLWRTEPEIRPERQAELEKCCALVPDVEKGIYPFKGMKLNRADVEWLLATHEGGPVHWSDEKERVREGLDVRGADLQQADLHQLPLTRLRGGLTFDEWLMATEEERSSAVVLMREANLFRAQLEGASLSGARLQGANLMEAQLQGAILFRAQLEGADLSRAQLEGVNFSEAQLEGANLRGVILGNQQGIGPQLADVQWGSTNLAVVDWSQVTKLGDEWEAMQKTLPLSVKKGKDERLNDYRAAVRANRQLAVALQAQGLSEEAARFAYRAQRLQRIVLRRQKKIGQYLFSGFLGLLAGYGYKPGRSVIAYLLLIVGFALTYYLFGHLAWYEALVVSLTAFHGRGFFSQQFRPGDPQSIIAALEAVVGLLIEISFIATFTQRFFGK
jgi:uncharacterized protein YjbI with pentapeptide repeats